MPELKFKPPLWISFYITAIQYFFVIIFLPAFQKTISGENNIFLLLSLPIAIVVSVAFVTHAEGLITFTYQGLRGYSCGQFCRGNHILSWDEIYLVEPYRYFGLQFLLVRYHSSDVPLWLPLFFKHQTKLNLLILEQTKKDNPLHAALLQTDSFKHLPWHSRVEKHKSDRYILESSYIDKIHISFKKYCLFWLNFAIIPSIFILAAFIDKHNLLEIGLVVVTYVFSFSLLWQLGLKSNYVATTANGIEVGISIAGQVHRFKIPWSEITEVKYYKFWVFEDLCVFSPVSLYGMNYTPIRLSLIDKAQLKTMIIAATHPENPLHEAVVRYL